MEYKANNHLLVSGDGKLSLPRQSECIRYLSSASLRKDSYIQIASEVIFCLITFTNGSYLLTILQKFPPSLFLSLSLPLSFFSRSFTLSHSLSLPISLLLALLLSLTRTQENTILNYVSCVIVYSNSFFSQIP